GFSAAYAQYNSLLWKISGKGLRKPSYVYGTIHIRDNRAFQLGTSVMPSFDSCSSFAGEIVLDPSSQAKVMGLIFMKGDTTLDMLLTKQDYKFVKDYAEKRLGVIASMVDKIKPMFTSSMINELDIKQDNAITLDEYFQKLAAEKNMNVVGIETMEEQVAAIDKIPLKQQAKLLVSGMKDQKSDAGMIEKMIRLYSAQNLDSLAILVNEYDTTDAFNSALILERNKIMASRIGHMIEKGPVFIGIGAAHLPGKNGVIELLKSQGFDVVPVYSSGKADAPKLTSSSNAVENDKAWQQYEEEDYFGVLLPGKPAMRYDTLKTSSDRIITATCLDTASAQLFVVNSFSASGKSLEKKKEDYFDELIARLTKDKNSKVIYKKKIHTPAGEAMEAEVKMMLGQILRIRVYTKDNKAVQLMTGGTKKVVESERAEKFFNSFHFIK
ncbi:MAG: TraB/GumN family protein, partial [Cytophagaceae bacterium]